MADAMEFRGIFPALPAPLDDREQFLSASFERLLERVYAAGVHGVFVSGHTGEGLAQPAPDRERAIDAAVRNSPRGKIVIAHVGAHRTADALHLARYAARAGAHAVSSLPPAPPFSFEEARNYFGALAAASDLPVFVYHFPELSNVSAGLDRLRQLLAIPNVVGIKFTDFDLYALSRLKVDGACVLNGHDEALAAGLLMGADGGVGSFYNLTPELFVQVYQQAVAGDWNGARNTQRRLNELIEITLRFPLRAALKTMLTWAGIPCGPCYAPHRNLSEDEESGLAGLLQSSSFAGADFARR
ncbi:MAG: dihydrodipicolinate synthase family protein [Bryobacteraceae bacterium]|nr:dihydrodipicolinate synthase family protein [Bryobacteraceae bacterium]